MSGPFDKEYLEYWKQRVANALDGAKVSDDHVQSFFLGRLGIAEGDSVLDIGCGHGRLFPLIAAYGAQIDGLDINQAAVEEAAAYPYRKLVCATAEKTTLPENTYDKVVAWATYDVVEQGEALVEENRITKTGGLVLITGKNKAYEADDEKAFVAERNAKLKDFPNHFTDVYGLMQDAAQFGFEVAHAYGFPRRGDFAELHSIDLTKEKDMPFYEFLLILRKIGAPRPDRPLICQEFSDTAIAKARDEGYQDMRAFFAKHKQDHA